MCVCMYVCMYAGFLRGWPADVELAAGLPERAGGPAVGRDTFCKHLQTFLFAVYGTTKYSALEFLRPFAI